MAIDLMRQSIELEQLVGEDIAQIQVKAEALVLGAGREEAVVLLEDARVIMGSVEVQTDRVVLDGTLSCQAVYRMGEESQVQSLSAQAAVSYVADIPGAGARMAAQVQAAVEHVQAEYENGRMVFTAVVAIRVRVNRLQMVELVQEIQGAEGLQTRVQTIQSVKTSAESGATAMLRDQVALPAALKANRALMCRAQGEVGAASPDLGGVRVNGKVQCEVLIGSEVPGRPVALVRYALPFDQLVELPDWLSGEVSAQADVRAIKADVREGDEEQDGVLDIELELDVTVRAGQTEDLKVICDLYATEGERLLPQFSPMTLCSGLHKLNLAEPFKGTLLLPEGAPGVGTVLMVRLQPQLAQWSAQEGRATFEGVLEATVLYMPAGSDKADSVKSELPFSVSGEGDLPQDAWVRVECGEVEATALLSDRLEIKANLLIEAAFGSTQTIQTVTGVEQQPSQPRRCGLAIVYPGSGDDGWTIGKRFQLPPERVGDVQCGQPLVLRL